MQKYVLEPPPDSDDDEQMLALHDKFVEWLNNPREQACVLPPGWRLQVIHDTPSDSATPPAPYSS